MGKIILLRHGQSEWNLENRFTGWTDVDLTDKGREEARAAGLKIKESGLEPRYYFTSYLKRAIHTLQIASEAMDREWVPVTKDWHLNERHYGALQGLNKADSYDVEPPALTADDSRFPGHDPRYASLSDDELPLTESLKTTIGRVRPCWEEFIAPAIRLYDTVLVAAHGNSLRALAMMLLHITPDKIMSVEIPTGAPWVFDLDPRLTVTASRYL